MFIYDILIFHGNNQKKCYFKLLFHLALISLKIEIFEKVHTKYFQIWCKKSILLSCLVILSLRLKVEYPYWNCIKFSITLKQHMSEMLGKTIFFLMICNLTNFMGSTRIKEKNEFD